MERGCSMTAPALIAVVVVLVLALALVGWWMGPGSIL